MGFIKRLLCGSDEVVEGVYIGNRTPSRRITPADWEPIPGNLRGTWMHLDPRQIPTDLKQPSMEAAQPPEVPKSGGG